MSAAERENDRLLNRLSHGAPLAAIVLVVLAVGLFVASRLIFILELIAIAALLALVLRVIVNGLERLGLPAWLAVTVIIAGIAAFGAFVWFVLIPSVLEEFRALTSEGPDGLQHRLQELISQASELLGGLPLIPEDFLGQLPQRLEQYLSGLLGNLPNALPGFASVFSSVFVGVVAVVFLALYFAISPRTYVSGIMRLVPVDRREGAREFVRRVGIRLRGWIVGTIIISIFVGVGVGVGLWIIGVPLALTFGIIAGVLNVIPFLGLAIAGLLPGLVALTISPTKALLVGALFIVIDQLDGNVLRPLIFGREIEMPPGWVLVSILILGVLLGPIVGTFLAIPAAVVVGVVIDELTEKEPPSVDSGAEEKPSSGPHT